MNTISRTVFKSLYNIINQFFQLGLNSNYQVHITFKLKFYKFEKLLDIFSNLCD